MIKKCVKKIMFLYLLREHIQRTGFNGSLFSIHLRGIFVVSIFVIFKSYIIDENPHDVLCSLCNAYLWSHSLSINLCCVFVTVTEICLILGIYHEVSSLNEIINNKNAFQ